LRHAKRLADLAEADWLAQWGRGIGPGSISRAFAAAGLPAPRQSVRCDSFNAMVSLIAQTDMVGALSQRLLDAGRVPPQLAPLQLGDGPTAFTVGVFYRSRAPLSPLATAMVKAIVASVRQSEGRPAT
jgi:DNA-binding transcriptional LysR family regulator